MNERVNKIFKFIINNKNVYISILIILCIFIVSIFLSNSKDTMATVEDTDTFTINCPATASKGGIIECSIVVNSVTMSMQGVSAAYNVSEGMEYVSFTKGDIWTDYSGGLNTGFVLVNFDGVTGSNLVGTVKFKVPNNANGNEIYRVELVDATIGDGGTTSITFDEVYDEVRILSDVNTLDNVSLSSGTLNEIFTKNKNNYTITTFDDKIIINATKSDENSSLSGDINEVSLHYGTNNLNIVVTSESGIKNTYTFSVYRPYEFKSEVYKYNKVKNYIYTGDDIQESTILSNISLPSELTADIENNKLIISYSNEKLLEIDILNIEFSNYSIVDKIIYVGKDITYDDFISTITLNGVSAKVYDNNETIISDGNISNDYKLKIYHSDTLLEEYLFNEEYLNIDNLNIDDENKIIKRVVLDTTYESLLSNISTSGSITVKDKDGNVINNYSKVKTGDIVEVKMSNSTHKYTVSVLGDLTGDGIANMGDVGLLYRYLKGKTELKDYQVSAGDAINTGSIKVNDVSRIYRYHKGKVDIVEVE